MTDRKGCRMSFSDSDLKRLKEEIEKEHSGFRQSMFALSRDQIEALLARLEDSEARLREREAEVKKAHHSLTVTVLELEKLKPRLEAAEKVIYGLVRFLDKEPIEIGDLIEPWLKIRGNKCGFYY